MRPLSACGSASSHKISPTSDNRSMSYGQRKRFSRWRSPPSWILKISIFGHVTVIGFNIWCNVPSFIKIGRFFTEIWRFNDFQYGGRPPSWIFENLQFLSCSHRRHTVLMSHTKFRWNRTIGRSMSYGQKSDFQDGGRRHLKFKKK